MDQAVMNKEFEMKDLLKEELNKILGSEEELGFIEEIQEEIVSAILPVSEADKQNSCTLEIMQAAGGSESSLFAEDILNMYKNYCNILNFNFKELNFQKDMAIGKGCKYANCVIEGEGVYKIFKHECGVHKV